MCDRADQVPQAIRSAFRQMTTGRPGAAHIGLPYDVMKQPVDAAEIWAQDEHDALSGLAHRPEPGGGRRGRRRDRSPRAGRCSSAAAASSPPAPPDALGAVATLLNAPVCTTVSGKGSIADTHPLSVGVVGLNGGVVADARGRAAGRPRDLRRLPRGIDDHRALDAAVARCRHRAHRRRSGRRSRPTTGRRTRSSATRGWCWRRCIERLRQRAAGRAAGGRRCDGSRARRAAKVDAFQPLADSLARRSGPSACSPS